MLSLLGRPLGLLVLALGFAGSGAYLYHRYRDADWERRYAKYQRQLHGDLTEREKQSEAFRGGAGARAQAHGLHEPSDLEDELL